MWKLQQPCILQLTLNDLDIWVMEHKMKLNPKNVHVAHMRHPHALPTRLIDQNTLEVWSIVLGVTIQGNLLWGSQVDHILSQQEALCSALFEEIWRNVWSVRDPELVSIYTDYMYPVLVYAVLVWHSSLTIDQAKRLEKMQKLACKIILGQRYLGYPESLCTFGLCTLTERHT